jgi:hypothetical protein
VLDGFGGTARLAANGSALTSVPPPHIVSPSIVRGSTPKRLRACARFRRKAHRTTEASD